MSLVIAVCALVGALAGIAGSAAAPSSSKKATAAAKKAAAARKPFRLLRRHAVIAGFGFGFGFGFGPGRGGPVHAQAVVPKRDGSGFLTITTDAGTLNSVEGTTVHLKEATDKATYKSDVGIDVGSDARVIRNGAQAKLSDLKQGDQVRVITGAPKGNVVIAFDSSFLAQQKQKFEQRMRQFKRHREFRYGAPMPGDAPPPPPGAPAPGNSTS